MNVLFFYDSGDWLGDSSAVHLGSPTEHLQGSRPSARARLLASPPLGLASGLFHDIIATGQGSKCAKAESARPGEVQALQFAQCHFHCFLLVKAATGPAQLYECVDSTSGWRTSKITLQRAVHTGMG